MTSLTEKRDLILDHEERFAASLAREVMPAPKMNLWMILIPFILVFHVIQHRRVVEGRSLFARNYLRSRRQGLEESVRSIEKGDKPRIERMLSESALPDSARAPLGEFFRLITAHYTDLLQADGPDMRSLIRSAYRSQTNYLLFLNRLNQAEKVVNDAVRPHVANARGVDEVLEAMEAASQRLRKEDAAAAFA
jgi:hypothetical protein